MAGPSGSPLQSIGAQTAAAISAARSAGFSGLNLVIIVAIARAESGLDPKAVNCNNPGGTCDRGIVQINNYWHPEVSDACAYNIYCAMKAAYAISKNGSDFSPWTTYKNKSYAAYLSSIANMAGVTIPDNLKQLETDAQNRNIPVVGAVVGAVQNAANLPGQILSQVEAFVTSAVPRIALFLFALILVVIGFLLLKG